MLRPVRSTLRSLVMVIGAMSVVACSFGDGATDATTPADDDAPGGSGPAAAEDPPDPVDDPPSCRHDELATGLQVELSGDEPADLARRVADSSYTCAAIAVAATDDDPWAAAIASPVARSVDSPLLLVTTPDDPSLASTLSGLASEELITVGFTSTSPPLPGTELIAPEPTDTATTPTEELRQVQLAVRVAEHLDTTRFLAVDIDDHDTRGAALARLDAEVAMLPLPVDQLAEVAEQLPVGAQIEVLGASAEDAQRLADGLTALDVDARPLETPDGLWPGGGTTTWLVDPSDGPTAAVGAVIAAARDERLLAIDAGDPRSGRERTMRIRDADAERHVLLGAIGDSAAWQLDTVLAGTPLPWGGFRLFEDERMVALYGSVETTALGVLGEQGLDDTVELARRVAEPYGADGARVLPAFELITTIASASAEPTGDYSRRTPIELLRSWIDRAAEEEMYVMLDLQPGRTDFLTQAQEYEELLREPHVGLALDPEWRLEPDQVHLTQIGSVEAAEVQEVADWLAALTREHRLPEKLLVLHQFRFSMLPDRDTIVAPPELAVVVHMDGQGPISTKYDTYAAITAGAEDRWLWGWKNFYDEDVPTPTPEQVLDLDPLPVFVTYQ